MGSKIKIFAISSIAVLVMMNMPCFAQIMPQIPASTLQAAREAAISQNAPSSEVVRVGIGTQNFGTY